MTDEVIQRHSFILPGVSREAFQDLAVRHTTDDDTLVWYLHQHSHDPYGGIPCNERCQVIRSGEVKFVTQMDEAKSTS